MLKVYYNILILYESASLLLYMDILRKHFRVLQNDVPTKTFLLPAAWLP